MNNQIQTASEVKYSSLASTSAHETCKNQKSRANFLSYLLFAAIALSAAFTSCNGDDDDNGGGIPIDPRKIVGTIPSDAKYSAVAKAKINVCYWSVAADDEVCNYFAEVDIVARNFTIELGEEIDAKFLHRRFANQPSSITVSNPNAMILWISDVLGYNADDEGLATFWLGTEGNNGFRAELHWVYSDRDVNVNGAEVEDDNWMEEMEVYSLTLKKGWNIVYRTTTQVTQGAKIEFSNNAIVTGLKWIGYLWSEDY